MSALTEISEVDELKAAVASTGEPRLIALLERLEVVEGRLAESNELRAAINAWVPPTSRGRSSKARLEALLARLEAVESVVQVNPAALAALKSQLDACVQAHNFSPKRAGRPSTIEADFQQFKARLDSKAVAPLNAVKAGNKGEGSCDHPFDPAELPEVLAADKACRTAMRFMRKLDKLRGNFDPRDTQADATAAQTKLAAVGALEMCAAGAPLDVARDAVNAARAAYELAAKAATANSKSQKSAERDASEGLNEAIAAAVVAVTAALAAHKKASSAPPPAPPAAPVPPAVSAPAPPVPQAVAAPPAAAKSGGGMMSAVQRRIKAIEEKMKGKKT